MRTDWVCNTRTYVEFSNAYALTEFDGVVGLPLTIADKVRKLSTGFAITTDVNSGHDTWTALPEGNRGSVLAVRGQVLLAPQEPLFGNTTTEVAIRLAIHEQDAGTLAPIVDPNYQLGLNPPIVLREAAAQANERFLWERKWSFQGATGTADGFTGQRMVDISWSGRRTLKPNEALFMIIQVGLNQAPIFFSPWLRTLMRVGE